MPTDRTALPSSHVISTPAQRCSIPLRFRWLGLLSLCLFSTSCASVEDCGGALGDKTDPRIRSSTVRMLLQEPADAYARFAPYAAMSALVYEEANGCKHALPPVEGKELLEKTLANAGWRRDDTLPILPKCDDDIGTFFRVWVKDHTDHLEVVMAFRGSKGGMRDWVNGNLRWLTRILPGDDQYDRSRQYAKHVLDYYEHGAGRPLGGKLVRFFSAGHSLGGGLAQNVLYSFPRSFVQAYAFDPSPVTGYADNTADGRRASCDCRESILGTEARVYRIYETDEVLAWVRLPLKLILPLNRQVQEVRLNTNAGHSISHLATTAIDIAGTKPLGQRNDWWRGRNDVTGKSCTDVYRRELQASCGKPTDAEACPR